ncbi:hypothetical protein, partial [Chryseobacterium takakiae]
MKKQIYLILAFLLCIKALAQGHNPGTVLPAVPNTLPWNVYTAAPDNRQNASVTNAQSLALLPTGTNGTDIFVNYLVDTTGYTFYLVYTTNGTAPSKTNGTVVNMSFAVFNSPNRIWAGKIPQQTSGTVVNYVIYANTTGGTLAAANNRIASASLGIQTTWTEGDTFYRFQSPGGVPGLRLWLRADQGTDTTTEGAAVNTVSDQSGNGFNALAPSPAANKPLFRTGNSAVGRDFNFNSYFDFTANRGFYNNQAIFTSDNNNGAYFVQAQHNGTVIGVLGTALMAVARGTTPGTPSYMDQAKFYFTSNTNLQWLANLINATVNDVTAAPALYSANWTGSAVANKILQMSSQGRRRITTGAITVLPWGGGQPSSQFAINDVHASGAGDNSGSFYAPEFI